MYDLDCVDDQHSHCKSVGKYHMVNRVKVYNGITCHVIYVLLDTFWPFDICALLLLVQVISADFYRGTWQFISRYWCNIFIFPGVCIPIKYIEKVFLSVTTLIHYFPVTGTNNNKIS